MPLLHQSLLGRACRLLSRRVICSQNMRALVRQGRGFSWTRDDDYDSDGEPDDVERLLGSQNPWYPLPGNVGSMAPIMTSLSEPNTTPARPDALAGCDGHRQIMLSGIDESLFRLGRSQRSRLQPLPEDLLHVIRNELCKVYLHIDPQKKKARVYAVSLKIDIDDLVGMVMSDGSQSSETDENIVNTANKPDDAKLDALQQKTLSDEDIKRISDFVYKQIASDFFTSPDADDDDDVA